MPRPPPRSPLFPYTTLFRSEETGDGSPGKLEHPHQTPRFFGYSWSIYSGTAISPRRNGRPRVNRPRSEEHTSELQSLRHLVCRLLLEKKKKKTPKQYHEQIY